MESRYGFTQDDARRIARTVHHHEANPSTGVPADNVREVGRRRLQIVLNEDLAGATDYDSPESARATVKVGRSGVDTLGSRGPDITVWNRFSASYSEGDFAHAVEVTEDDRWYIDPGGSADAGSILSFLIVSSDPSTRSALVEIRQRTFDGTAFGSILDDTVVTVYDTDGCHLNEPNVDLTGRRGKAVLMLVDEEADELHFGGVGYGPEKYWNVLTICCPGDVGTCG